MLAGSLPQSDRFSSDVGLSVESPRCPESFGRSSRPNVSSQLPSFDRYAFGKIAWFIYIATEYDGDMIGE